MPGGATIIKGLTGSVLGAGTPGVAVAKPGVTAVGAQQTATAAGKQTIVIASPRGPTVGASPGARIMTAIPRGVGTPGAQYIVMTTRAGTPGTATPGAVPAGQRVISTYR